MYLKEITKNKNIKIIVFMFIFMFISMSKRNYSPVAKRFVSSWSAVCFGSNAIALQSMWVYEILAETNVLSYAKTNATSLRYQ